MRASSPDTPRPVRIMSSAWLCANEPGKAHRAAVDQRHAPAPAEHAEHRIRRGDAQIAPERELESAGDRVALDRGDHRLRQQHARRAQRTVAVDATSDCRRRSATAFRSAPAQNVPSAPVSTATSLVVVGVEATERLRERRGGRTVDGVAHLGSVDRDDRDTPARLDVDRYMVPPRARTERGL